MAGTITEDYGMSLRSSATEGMLSEQRCLSGDSIAEWRSSEQVENGTASTSPPYWDTDDDDDCGPKPLDLYGRFTWKIESFSTINKRELRSNAFEVGGYKWYILIYPQGCDVCNHLSLFLCVANHDKLLPGWSHFAQFTIAVVNKDPKKSKYSDTLHRFWKKEHDWGWKKFMELSKVYDGFVVADTLVIKAQVQVIRERTDRPFRCLDCQYRRELVRVYLSNVEQICRRFLEERIGKLNKFVEDKAKWPSFRAFWLGIDSNARRRMSRDKTDAILKVVVKHFFIEKEVTSTLVMDSLYSGLKALEFQNKNMKGRAKLIELEELPAPMVHIDQDFFVLADDVIVLIERVVSDSLSHQPLPSKDDKCLQNRTKDGSSDEFNKDAVERDERRLMELGRKTIEIFVLLHIFSSRIEVSYQEAVALKRQEELIREEEAAGQAENELKSKRIASDKEKRAKKKQTKQKRNGRKGKEKVKDERFNPPQERLQRRSPSEERSSENSSEQVELVVEKNGTPEDTSDVSDTGDDGVDVIQPDLDDRASSPTNWDTDTSEIHRAAEASGVEVQNSQIEKRSQSVIDDSSSTCSTDSIPSALVSGSSKDSAVANNKLQPSTNRGKNHWSNEKAHSIGLNNGGHISQPETTLVDLRSHDATSSKVLQTESDTTASSLKSEMLHLEKNIAEKEEFTTVRKKVTSKDPVDADRQSPSPSLCRKPPAYIQQTKQSLITIASLPVATTATELASSKDPPSSRIAQTEKVITLASRSTSSASSIQTEAKNLNAPIRISSPQQTNATSRPSSAPLIAAPRATAPISSTVQVVPLLSRSVSATGRLGNDPSQSASAFVPQSYRNAIMGRSMNSKGPVLIDDTDSSSQSVAFSRSVSSVPMLPPQTPIKKEQVPIQPGLTFGCLKPEVVHTQQLRGDDSYHGSTTTTTTTTTTTSSSNDNQRFGSVLTDNMGKLDIYGKFQKKQYSAEIATVTSCIQGTVAEEFPHLDIINDLLDDDQHIGRSARSSHHAFSRQFSLPGNLSTADVGSLGSSGRYDQSEYFEEGFPRGYGASINLPQGLREEHFHHMDISAYTNSRYDGLMRSQLPYRNADQSTMFSLGDGDANGYGYHLREYFARRGNGYLYRPNEP